MIVPEEAKIVRRIFSEYINGRNIIKITEGLTENGIRNVTGTERWNTSSALSIFRNEKYMGDCLMQKYYDGDFLAKKQVKNQGELQQYYVKDHHELIRHRGGLPRSPAAAGRKQHKEPSVGCEGFLVNVCYLKKG